MVEEIIYEDRTYKLGRQGLRYCHPNMTEEERMKGLHSIKEEGVSLAEAWIDALREAGEYQLFSADEKLTRYARSKLRGSYSLKHTAERWAGTYISNGEMIQAARNKGLATIISRGEGLNCQIGIYFTKKQENEYYLHKRNIPMTQGDLEREKKALERSAWEPTVSHEVSTLFKEIK